MPPGTSSRAGGWLGSGPLTSGAGEEAPDVHRGCCELRQRPAPGFPALPGQGSPAGLVTDWFFSAWFFYRLEQGPGAAGVAFPLGPELPPLPFPASVFRLCPGGAGVEELLQEPRASLLPTQRCLSRSGGGEGGGPGRGRARLSQCSRGHRFHRFFYAPAPRRQFKSPEEAGREPALFSGEGERGGEGPYAGWVCL